MNTQQNKAYLWKQCIEQGVFNTLNSSVLPSVQKRFEDLVQEYDKTEDTIELKNEQFLREFRNRLMPSFEETQKEYDKLLQPPKPAPVEFTREPDKPMQDLTALLEKTTERRNEEMRQLFSDKPTQGTVGSGSPFDKPMVSGPDTALERTLQKHTEMLLSILETQMKLIDYLQRNKK
jgi:hypothetical protein